MGNRPGHGRITVYYDGACPSCVRDRRAYERLAGPAGAVVDWFDITGRETHLRRIGIDPQEALRELHVRREDGTVLREMDAYTLLLRRVPLLRPLTRLIERPSVRAHLSRAYRRMVDDRLERTGRLPGRPREGAVQRADPAGKAAAPPRSLEIPTARGRSGARQGGCGKGET